MSPNPSSPLPAMLSAIPLVPINPPSAAPTDLTANAVPARDADTPPAATCPEDLSELTPASVEPSLVEPSRPSSNIPSSNVPRSDVGPASSDPPNLLPIKFPPSTDPHAPSTIAPPLQ
ncbi:hypothetical protein BC827DRAFT_1266013 [Russula dissimulans]|nr:hypothetical protein BC827DRAFT_1266013 [Russula dissimulans]